jgi:chromosome partitioning protein
MPRHRQGTKRVPPLRVVTVTNFKGGSGKSTSAGLLIHAWAALGYRVLGVDADPQGTLQRWREDGEWSVPVMSLPSPRMHEENRGLGGLVSPDLFDLVVVDTPPLELQRGIVLSAIRAATDVVVTLAPTSAEWDVLPKVWEAIDEVAVTRVRPAPVSVLWNRVRGGTTSAKVYREQLVEQGRYCLTAALPLAERYAQAIGAPVELRPGDVAIQAAEEITRRGGWAA